MALATRLARAVGVVVCVMFPVAGHAQSRPPADPVVPRAVRTTQPIVLDGILEEPAWFTTDSITDFTQSEPEEGHLATERTVVRLLAAGSGLYVGLWAYDSVPSAIRHAQLRRDSDFGSDDSFTLMLDPLRDHRTGYLFAVNPNGAMSDAEVINFETTNPDWNGVWDARARVTGFGWTAEIFIPWQTLRYREDGAVWGANFDRFIRRKNEEVLWRAWHRTEGILFLPGEGMVAGLNRLPPRAIAELRPYTSVTGQLRELRYPPDGSDSVLALGDRSLKTGLDAKVAVASTLTLDLTANTDFAQVEADNQVINLTRFPLFFPEKRAFFLEASGILSFGQADRTTLFYSRRIGLDPLGNPISLTAGGRLTGRVGREQLGLLAVRTGEPETAVDLVARLKHDVFSRGYIGGILTSQSGRGSDGGNLSGGADFSFPLFVRGQNLVFGGYAAGSRDSAGAPLASAWHLSVDFPNDFMDNFVGVSRVEPGFAPALGFVSETDLLRHTGHVDIFPRPHRFGIRRLHFRPLTWEGVTHLDGSPSHARYEMTPLGAIFQSGDEFLINLKRLQDAPSSPFEIFTGDTIAPGNYYYNRAELVFSSSPGRAVGVGLTASVGDFYTGTATELETALTVRTAPHVITNLEASEQSARLATERFTARTARLRLDVAASPRLGTTFFLQWDNESDRLTLNARLHWIPSPGSDAYLVWNGAWPTALDRGIPWSRPARGAVVGKLVYYFRL